MSKEKILAMKAGRELDALVADKVMNLCVVDTLQTYGEGCVASDKCMDEWFKHPEYGKNADPDSLETYSSNISAAWEVFEKNGYQGGISYQGSDYFCELWSAWDESGAGVHVRAIAETAPEAICKAALIANLSII